MLIDNRVDEKLLKTLIFGSFPKNIEEFQDSQAYIEQISFVDFQLKSFIQAEYGGHDLMIKEDINGQLEKDQSHRLSELIEYMKSIDANYSTQAKEYHENVYYCTVLAHLYFLNSQIPELNKALSSIFVNGLDKIEKTKTIVDEFTKYISTRFKVIQGYANEDRATSVWFEYMSQWQPYFFNKSNVAANIWLDLMFERLAFIISMEGSQRIEFQQVRQLPFTSNKSSLIAFCNFLCRHKNRHMTSLSFKKEFGGWLSKILEVEITENSEQFPAANNTEARLGINSFVDNLFEGIGSVPYYYTLLKPTLAKRYLINLMSKTYQSQTVLSSFIKTLIDLKEYDEAFAAMKTYVAYIEVDERQHNGEVDNILSVIDTYTACLYAFNPVESFSFRKSKKSKFKETKIFEVVEQLLKLSQHLIRYLDKVAQICQIRYNLNDNEDGNISKNDNEVNEEDKLSFIYKNYNHNLLTTDRSFFVDLISKSWFSIGKLYDYMATYEASSETQLNDFTKSMLENYKKALIINSSGNCEILFAYAYTLANTGGLNSAMKLCKFILKKFPESFKTWNLLVLLVSAYEVHNPDKYTEPVSADKEFERGKTIESVKAVDGESTAKQHESEKLINNALNIAGLFIEKYTIQSSMQLSEETKYQIIQLKLTHLAVLESIYGSSHILENLKEIFSLFYELFDVDFSAFSQESKKVDSKLNAWSHRPSIVDPTMYEKHKKDKKKSMEVDHVSEKLKNVGGKPDKSKRISTYKTEGSDYLYERRLLQELWLWTSGVYAKNGDLKEAEQCIVEAETIYEPNVKTHAYLGFLTSKSRKFLSLQEFERSLEILNVNKFVNKKELGLTLLGLCKLFVLDDEPGSSVFISETDKGAAMVRMKNALENFTYSWPYGANNSEIWWYLSLIYDIIDDEVLLHKSLWKSIDLEEYRPVRDYSICIPFELS